MTLPEHQKSKYKILPEGDYSIRITDPPEKRRFGKAVGIILKFIAIDSSGNQEKASCLVWPWSDEYGDLKKLVGSSEEEDWVGKEFNVEIVHETIKGNARHQIKNLRFPEWFKEKEKEDGDVPPPPPPSSLEKELKEERAKNLKEEDPGPGDEDDPGAEEEEGKPPF